MGLSTWYSWWDQKAWNKNKTGEVINFDPAFFYGPVLSVKLTDYFNLTFVYLYAKFDNEKETSLGIKKNIKHKRTDSDLALNYRLNNYFKVFAGIKYMPYKSEGVTKGAADTLTKTNHNGLGPGLGISSTYPILDSLFLLTTLSGFYLWSDEDGSSDDGNTIEKFKHDYKRYGLNSTLSFAYYIAPASTTISLGARLQYYRSDYKGDKPDYVDNMFYGITLTATYSFNI